MRAYTDEELKYIRDHYKSDGYTAVANYLGRSTSAIRTRAHMLGVTDKYNKSKPEDAERMNIRRLKVDVNKNGDERQLIELMKKRQFDDKDKVMLKVKTNTWVMVPRKLATREYAEMLRKRWNDNEKKHYG